MNNILVSTILLSLGGSLGAGTRYWITGLFKKSNSYLPYGTLVVNSLGSFFLGIVLTFSKTYDFPYEFVLLIGTGFLGAFTTMSTFAVETLTMKEESNKYAMINILVMISFVLSGVYIGQNISKNFHNFVRTVP